MNRIAIFAHYNKNNVIEDYVIYYIKELKKVADKIIFVSDSEIEDLEIAKIRDYIEYSIAYHHGEYDFGSYKRGYLKALELGLLGDCEELIFANDSCYAPLFPFDEMFNKMSPKEVDFWGATKNRYGFCFENGKKISKKIDHVQSYFIVFKKNVFNSEIFKNFINSICKKNSKFEIIAEYEIGLTELLAKNGYKWDVYSEISKNIEINNSTITMPKELVKNEQFPFLKRNLVCMIGIENLINKFTNYDFNLIKIDRKHNKLKLPMITKFYNIFKFYRQRLIRIHLRDKHIIILGHYLDFKKTS